MLVSKNDKNINVFDKRDSMYPSYGLLIGNEHFVKASEIGWATMFGYSEFTCQIQIGETVHHLGKNNYFSLVTKNNDVLFKPISNSIIFVVFRLGFIGVNLVGELDVEKPGKLSYIDGCSDSMLVYPPRFGDPNLNYLHFPKNIDQTKHTHPSIRIGYIVSGNGKAETTKSLKLKPGTMFCLEEHELHKFKTENSQMKLVVYHPDSDWGPTDQNHTMLNRTYIK